MGPPSRGLTTCRRDRKGPVLRGSGSSRRRGPRQPDPWTRKLALGTWNVTSLEGKEPEIVREVERFRLEIVGITSTHGWGSGTTLLERGWTLHHSGVAHGERRRAGVGLLIAPQLSRHVLEFTPVNERVVSLHLRGIGLSLSCVPTAQTAVLSTRPSWCLWEGCWKVLQLGTPSFYWGTSMPTWAATVTPGGA